MPAQKAAAVPAEWPDDVKGRLREGQEEVDEVDEEESGSSDEVEATSSDELDEPPKACTRLSTACPSCYRSCLSTPRRRLVCCCSTVLGLLLLAVAIAVPFLLPKDPIWELKKLDVDAKALAGLIAAVTGQLHGVMPQLNMTAVVELWNPNFIGALAEPGLFTLYFEGDRLGTGRTQWLDVRRRGHITATVDVLIDLDEPLAKKLSAAVMASNFMITATVQGEAQIKAGGFLPMTCQIHCDVVADVLKMMSEHKEEVVKGYTCSYPCFFEL